MGRIDLILKGATIAAGFATSATMLAYSMTEKEPHIVETRHENGLTLSIHSEEADAIVHDLLSAFRLKMGPEVVLATEAMSSDGHQYVFAYQEPTLKI